MEKSSRDITLAGTFSLTSDKSYNVSTETLHILAIYPCIEFYPSANKRHKERGEWTADERVRSSFVEH